MKVLTTIADGDYFLGMAALINSVSRQGGQVDKFVVGYRGELPDWLPPTIRSNFGSVFELPSGRDVELVRLDGDLHIVHEKPRWLRHVATTVEPQASELFFFDADIVVINRMSFFEEWVANGICLCEDVNYDMAHNSPIRLAWKRYAVEAGLVITNDNLNRYYNSGFLGWNRDTECFIDDWVTALDVLRPFAGSLKKWRTGDRTYPVFSGNQDSLNLAAMITSAPLSTLGPGAMQFDWSFPLMSHPVGENPWARNDVRQFLKGYPPRIGDVAFWKNIDGPELTPCGRARALLSLNGCRALRGLSRFYARRSS